MSKPARLHKCNAHETLDNQLSISVLQLVFITFLVILFMALCFIIKGPTYGVL